MKKIIPAIATIYIIVLVFVSFSYAQESYSLVAQKKDHQKLSTSIINSNNNTNAENLKEISAAALKSFETHFKNTPVNYWTKLVDGYEANFKSNGIKIKAYFDKTSTLVYIRKYYEEDKLPVDIMKIVKGTYYDYNINLVEELNVIADNNIVYVIHMENKTSWKNITVCNGEMNIFSDIAK